jgi:hypothetical protein
LAEVLGRSTRSLGTTVKVVARVSRACARARFRLLGHASILDIPTLQFNDLLDALIKQGWRKTYEYDGFDAWIDYGKVVLKKDGTALTFEWDNWTEGGIEGPKVALEAIAVERGLVVSDRWRWDVAGASGA